MKAELDKKGNWEKPKSLPSKINREGFHTGNPRFSEDGQRMYFTRALMENDRITESKIFMSQKGRSGWGAAKEVPNVNGEYLATHPTVGRLLGNEVLIFSANINGGEGGTDLYYSIRRGEDDYTNPRQYGDRKINTAG